MNQVGVIGPTNAALIERTSGLELGSLEAVARRIGFLLASRGRPWSASQTGALAYGRLMPISMQVSPYQFSKGTM